MMAGLASTVAQGMAFGTGSAIAHRAVGAVAGSVGGGGEDEGAPVQQGGAQQEEEEEPCRLPSTQFYKCLDSNEGNIAACQMFFDAMSQCQRDEEQRRQYA